MLKPIVSGGSSLDRESEPGKWQPPEPEVSKPRGSKGMLGGYSVPMKYDKPIEHHSAYWPDGYLCFEIIGRSGCGKSHILRDIIGTLEHEITQVIIFSRKPENPVYTAIEEWCKDEHREASDDRGIYFKSFSDPAMINDEGLSKSEGILSCKDMKDPDTWGIIVFDDFTAMKPSRSDPYVSAINLVASMFRNDKYYSCIITQNPTNVPTLFRTNVTVRIIFDFGETHGLRSIWADVEDLFNRNRERFDKLYNMIHAVPHSYMICTIDKIYVYIHGKTKVPQEVDFGGSDQKRR